MLKVVIDTNVMVSSLWGGKPRKIIDLWKEGKIRPVISLTILEEYMETLSEFGISREELVEKGLLFYEPGKAEIVQPREKISVIKEDPEDDKFLEAAVAGKVKYIVSGDRHLKNLKEFKGIRILSVDDFLRKIR